MSGDEYQGRHPGPRPWPRGVVQFAVANLIAALVFGLFAASPAADAQPARPVPRIGVLWPTSDSPALQAFRQGLQDLGYVEGQNVLIEYRYAQGKDDRLPELVADLVRLKVDVILTYGVTAARVATRATTTIPIVNGSMSDPVEARLVASLAKPGGNLTGLTSRSPELSAKRLELIKEVVPGLSRLAVLGTTGRTATLASEEIELTARSLGVTIQALSVRGPDDLDSAVSAMAKERAGALLVVPDLMFNEHRKRLVDLVARHRLPATYFSKDFVEAGGLMSYAPSFTNQFRRSAVYVDKILKGANPSELPIEAPTKFELVINLKAAKALGLAIPQSLLLRADEVIQ
jgi:putative ABC transport system substrate-binding protein